MSFGENAANVALIDFVGQVQLHAVHPYPTLQESSVGLAGKIEQGLLTLAPADRARVAGIGLAVPDDAGTSHHVREILGRDLGDIQASLEARLNLSVYIQNEITAAAGGESLFGVARSFSDFLFFYLGSRMHSRLILNYQIHSGRSDLSHDIGLLRLQEQLNEHGLTLDDIGSETLPAAVDDLYAEWRRTCCRRIVGSVRSLLSFVSFKSVVISSYAPSSLGGSLCSQLHEELPELDFLFGANSIAPKALGAASLPYHSRFMVQ